MNETAELKNSQSGQDTEERRCSRKSEVKTEKEPPADITTSVYPWRIFVNHIDSYHGSKIADYILDQTFGSSTKGSSYYDEMEGEEEEEEEENKQLEELEEMSEEQMSNSEVESKKPESTEKLPPARYQVLATAQSREYIADEGIVVVPSLTENKEEFLSQLLTCSFIVYDITQDKSQIAEANWVLDELTRLLEEYQSIRPRAFASRCSVRHFLLVSSVMTWARTKPVGGGGDEAPPLTEAKRRRRRAHPSARAELECERNVTRRRPGLDAKLRRLVLCAGVTYGAGEDRLHYAFKLGWMNEPRLPVVGAGGNLVPLLHVRDLASAVHSVIKKWPELNYIVAVEPHQTSQKNLIKAISECLTTGDIKHVTRDELLAYPDVSSRDCDAISLDLRFAPGYLIESGALPWLAGSHFLASVESVVQDYRSTRHLLPVRLLVLGSPYAGKSMLARALARHYRLHYVETRKLIADTAQQLVNEINEIKKGDKETNKRNEDSANEEEEEAAEDEREETVKDAQVLENRQALLNEIQGGLEQNNGRLNNDVLTKIFRRKLLSKECQNQGYVVDGYPKTLEQARLLFAPGQDGNYEDTVGDEPLPEEALIPELVIVLEASDDFLVDRLINSAERESAASRAKDEYIYERLRRYRERNSDEDTPLQLFDELEVQPVVFDVEEDTSPQMQRSFRYCLNLIGPPRNYGLSPEEAMEERRRAEAEAAAAAALAAAERERQNAERRREREKPAMEWTELLQNLKLEEEERLCIKSEPLRHYLAKCVFPILIKGLTEVVKLRPNEPIDYLAEYLLKANPEGRDLEPDYTQSMHAMFSSIHKFQNEGVLGGKSVYDYLKTSDGSDGRLGIKCCCCYCKDQSFDVVTIPLSSCASSYEKEDEGE